MDKTWSGFQFSAASLPFSVQLSTERREGGDNFDQNLEVLRVNTGQCTYTRIYWLSRRVGRIKSECILNQGKKVEGEDPAAEWLG